MTGLEIVFKKQWNIITDGLTKHMIIALLVVVVICAMLIYRIYNKHQGKIMVEMTIILIFTMIDSHDTECLQKDATPCLLPFPDS